MSVNTSPPRVALIGCGRWGRNIARVLARLGALELIVDPAAEALKAYADELGVKVSADVNSALDRQIDAIAIAVPAADHAQVIRKALEAGKPVFVEKPLALQVDEARELATLATERGLTLMVGHLLQYHPAFTTLKSVLASGAIGELRHINSNRLNPGAIRTEENALWSMAPHDFSMVLALTGAQPTHVSTLAVRVVNPAIPDKYSVQMVFPGQVTAQVNVSWLSPYKEHKLTVLGAHGAIVFDDTAAERSGKLLLYRNYVEKSDSGPRFVKSAGEAVDWPAEEPLEAEMRAFLSAARGGEGNGTGPDEAIPVLDLLHRAGAAVVA